MAGKKLCARAFPLRTCTDYRITVNPHLTITTHTHLCTASVGAEPSPSPSSTCLASKDFRVLATFAATALWAWAGDRDDSAAVLTDASPDSWPLPTTSR